MSEILVESRYLTHEGGTKFYEVIQLYNVSQRRFVSIRRWGKMTASDGGGDVKIESYGDVRQCQNASVKILNEKEKRGYSRATPPLSGLALADKIYSSRVLEKLKVHYHDRDVATQVVSLLGIHEMREIEDTGIIDEGIDEPTKPEPERGGDWASW